MKIHYFELGVLNELSTVPLQYPYCTVLFIFIQRFCFTKKSTYKLLQRNGQTTITVQTFVTNSLIFVIFVCVAGDEAAQAGAADCQLSAVSGALQRPHHTGRAEPEGERPCSLPPDRPKRSRKVSRAVRRHTSAHSAM